MSTTTCTRRLEFDAAHRVLGHRGQCRFLHGHRYAVEVTCQVPELDRLGMVVDFAVVKNRVGGWIAAHLDHNVILNVDDPLALLWSSMTPEQHEDPAGVFAGRAPVVLDGNPTAENIAAKILRESVLLLPGDLQVRRVRVYETPNCWADVYND